MKRVLIALFIVAAIVGVTLIALFMINSHTQMRVMTINLRQDNPDDGEDNWQYRREMVVECLKGYNLDLIGTQEGFVHQIEYLDEELSEFGRVGIGRVDGVTKGEYSAVYYRKSRFELISENHTWLSETPDTPSLGWDAGSIRIATTAVLRDLKTGRTVHFINTHFDNAGEQARRESPRIILEMVAAAGNNAVIFTGDLNSTPESEPISLLLEGGLLRDSGSEAELCSGAQSTFNGFNKSLPEDRLIIIDYVMYNKRLKAVENRVVSEDYGERQISDHFPVFALLRYRWW